MADATLIISLISLFISMIAFMVTAAQALQQYISSGKGYSSCQSSVIEEWAKGTSRSFMWSEFRFVTWFETPVIWLARPENQRGPLPGRRICTLDGTDQSYRDARTIHPNTLNARKVAALQGRDTAFNTRATWVVLLEIIQVMERSSREWEPARRGQPSGRQSLAKQPNHTIAVQLQARRQNWDFQPADVLRPYAQTTLSHIAELAVLLGMRWKKFDPDNGSIQAQGNGLIITSSSISTVGLFVSFDVSGRSVFTLNRTIPCYELKDIVFGTVPTIWEDWNAIDSVLPRSWCLKFGSQQDIEQTLRSLGCSTYTVEKYFGGHTHIRSSTYRLSSSSFGKDESDMSTVDFELIAMIGQVFRIRGSNFKMLPNPSPDNWNKILTAPRLMLQFWRYLEEHLAEAYTPLSEQQKSIRDAWSEIRQCWKETEHEIDLELREAVHDAIEGCDSYLSLQDSVVYVVRQHINAVIIDLTEPTTVLASQRDIDEAILMAEYFTSIRDRVVASATGQNDPWALLSVEKRSDRPQEELAKSYNEIWLTLMFRMCCWWFLHDFEPGDRLVVPSRFWASRVPAFIT